jgi:hypothetical protein
MGIPMTAENRSNNIEKAAILPPFAQRVICKLRRFEECTSDGQGADIGRHWFDLLTQLGLLNRVQHSPALWEITQQGEDLLETKTDRSPKDYAIEHAEYMAKSADHVIAEFQAYGLALMAVDEGGDDGESELFDAIDSARQDLQEALVDLRGMVFEFRKRLHRITPL